MLSDGYKIYYVLIMLFNENTAIKNVPWSQDIDKSVDLIWLKLLFLTILN